MTKQATRQINLRDQWHAAAEYHLKHKGVYHARRWVHFVTLFAKLYRTCKHPVGYDAKTTRCPVCYKAY